MKNIVIGSFIMSAVFATVAIYAQGTVYLTGLNQPSEGITSVSSDSWVAAGFVTGGNVGGYLLNSVQLGIADASGNPTGFTVMLYGKDPEYLPAVVPGSSLNTLNGSADPSTAGVYTYTPDADILLLRNTFYFVVLTAETTLANGAFEWNQNTAPPTLNGGWGGGGTYLSGDGLNWGSFSGNYGQFSITATPIPEPTSVFLFLIGGGLFAFARRRFKG